MAAHEVVGVLARLPRSVTEVGVTVAAARGSVPPQPFDGPVSRWLASVGVSLSAVQQTLDALVRDGAAVEVKGRDLWALELPTEGTKAMGRYYLSPG